MKTHYTVTATNEQLWSIGIPLDDSLKKGSIVEIISEVDFIHPEHGDLVEIGEVGQEYHNYGIGGFHIPKKWLSDENS